MKETALACCGLDCSACNLYNAAHDLHAAEALVEWFRARGWIGEGEGAEAVQRKAPFCMGCRDRTARQWCSDCKLRQCCDEKALSHCGECASFPCDTYREWTVDTPHHQAAMEFLLSKRE